MEQHKVQHRGHPHGNAHVGAVVQHVEAEIDQEDLHRDDHAVQDAGQDAGLEVLPEGPAVGCPPVTGLVTQARSTVSYMPASAGPARMPPAMALTIITVRLFIRKPMYTRQITGRKPMQVSRFARNMPLISRPTSSKKRPTPVLRGVSFSTPDPSLKSLEEGNKPICSGIPLFCNGQQCHCATFLLINIPGFCGFCKLKSTYL